MCPSAWVATKPLWWWPGGHIVFMMTYIYYAHLASVRFEQSVCREIVCVDIYIYIYICIYMYMYIYIYIYYVRKFIFPIAFTFLLFFMIVWWLIFVFVFMPLNSSLSSQESILTCLLFSDWTLSFSLWFYYVIL